MPELQITLEVERIVNLVRGFGWEAKSEIIDGDKIRLTIEKTITPKVGPEANL